MQDLLSFLYKVHTPRYFAFLGVVCLFVFIMGFIGYQITLPIYIIIGLIAFCLTLLGIFDK